MSLSPADLREAALAVNCPPLTSNVPLAARLRAEAEIYEAAENDRHASDCATHNAPAYEPGPCNCGLDQ